MLQIKNKIIIPHSELEISAIRSQGAGGQNVNKVATAIHLSFNVEASLHSQTRRHLAKGYAYVPKTRHPTLWKSRVLITK
ncbi:peptide chain release factor-like protein [Nostoc sp. FACHB-110]|uniref:peptide chain release factor-like protein n=1 Tax=Nostoc sp. FACHB-110 TaxID=2692834 RepID=UPI001684BE35|nr:peptide chain release factor-like protein [Nostoc sp. FACHB-110]MBD2441120.1 hypothetical protein [Nostoc sp. FACHB-110]